MKRIVVAITIAVAVIGSSYVDRASAQTPTILVDPAVAARGGEIVNGVVVSTTEVDLDGNPHTVHEVRIERAVRGTRTGSVLIEVPGGTRADGAMVVVSHQPYLQDGDRVQLALGPTDDGVDRKLAVALDSGLDVFSVDGGMEGTHWILGEGISSAEAAGDFALTGAKWTGFVPAVSYKVNTTNSGVTAEATQAAVQRAFDRWEADPLSKIDFTYSGPTTLSDVNLGDGVNTISWVASNQGWLAQAQWIANGSGIIGFDIRINTAFRWADGATAGAWDIETTVAHEAGHVIGLGHAPAVSEVMFSSIAVNTVKPLGLGDLNGARTLYPDPGITSPSAGAVLPCGSAAVQFSGSTSGLWHVRAGSSPLGLNYFAGNSSSGTSITVTGLPSNGTQAHVSLWHLPPGGAWVVEDQVVYSACGSAGITSPAAGSVLACSSAPVAFSGSASGVWHVRAGSSPQAFNYFAGNSTNGTSTTVTGLPGNGTPVHLSLWHLPVGGAWTLHDQKVYTACGSAAITSPAPGSVLACSAAGVQFSGSASGLWHVRAGSSAQAFDYFAGNSTNGTSIAVSGLPSNGTPVHLSLWHLPVGGSWTLLDQKVYSACGSATIASPVVGSVLPCGSVAVQFTGGSTGIWHMRAGSTPLAFNYFAGNSTTGTSITVTGLPSNGSSVHLSLWHLPAGGTWTLMREVTHKACG